MKSHLALNFDRGFIEQVGVKTEGSQCILTSCYKKRITAEHIGGCDLSSFVDIDFENYVALNSLFHRFLGINRHRFAFDESKHYFGGNVNGLRSGLRLPCGRL